MKKILLISVMLLCIVFSQALAQTVEPTVGQPVSPIVNTTVDMSKIADILIVFLVLSVVFEVALTPIFNWRIFIKNFDGKGLKTPVTVILALIVFWTYDLDIVSDLLFAMGKRQDAAPTFGGQFLTALLIAGGSAGVLKIFARLGIREKPDERANRIAQIKSA